MPRKHLSQIQADEHSTVGGVSAKKVFVIDNTGNQITDFGGEKLPTQGNNSSSLISYNSAGETVYVDEIIDGITYRTTFTRSDMTVSSTLAISQAVAQ